MLAASAVDPRALGSPTIKGIFVNSHVAAVRKVKGPEGVRRLEEAFGAPLSFRDLDDVPVRDEVRLIELASDILVGHHASLQARAFDAGRLHFRNFKGTPLAKVVFALFPRDFHYLMLHAPSIAEKVFKGVRFEAADLGGRGVRVTMENNDYPIEHFRGLFHEWMNDFGLRGEVAARETGPGRYEYVMRW